MIDLDDLERKATAVPFGEPPAPIDDAALTQQAAGYHDFNAIESMACELRHRRHKQVVIDAVPVLIARIRELEGTLRESIAHHRSVRDLGRDEGMLIDADEVNEETAWINGLMRLLKKGAVLP